MTCANCLAVGEHLVYFDFVFLLLFYNNPCLLLFIRWVYKWFQRCSQGLQYIRAFIAEDWY